MLLLPSLVFRPVMAPTRKMYWTQWREAEGTAQTTAIHTASRLTRVPTSLVSILVAARPVLLKIMDVLPSPVLPRTVTPHPSTPHLSALLASGPATADSALFPSSPLRPVTAPVTFLANCQYTYRHLVQEEDNTINRLKKLKMQVQTENKTDP